MSAILNIYDTIVLFGDTQISSNPQKQIANWSRKLCNVQVTNAATEQLSITPGATLAVFNGVRATTLDGTTTFATSVNTVIPATYRFSWTGGTNPTLRTDRSLAFSSIPVSISINNNILATFTGPSASFSSVSVGDTLWLPGPTTGDVATPFSVLNQGLWVVVGLGAGGASVMAIRPAGTLFSGITETQTPTSNAQLTAFSSAGVQIGDTVDISAGFASTTLGTFEVSNVTSTFFEIQNGLPLAVQTGIMPGAAGMVFYTMAKQYLRIESDQLIVVQINGDTSNGVRVSPLVPGDPNNMGFMEIFGPVWSLTVINRSTINTCNIVMISAE